MAVKSVYLPKPVFDDGQLRIAGDEHHHLSVGRVEERETVEVFDGRGSVWTTKVLTSGRRETVVQVVESRIVPRAGPDLLLGLSLIKPAAFELALEKVVEVGVNRIIPVIAARSNAPPRARKSDRWKRVVIEAAKQSKRYHLPVVEEPVRLAAAFDIQAATKIVFAERGGGPLKSALAGSPALFLVGPEGGWTDAELESARKQGFHLVGLGDGTLRSETAAIVGAALIRHELQGTS
jgi:16S rRNA (uracil1498-N3)-methyltransferase